MARLPRWMKQVEGPHFEDGKCVVTIRIRYWHPYVWWLLLRRWTRRRGDGEDVA